jgi:transposase
LIAVIEMSLSSWLVAGIVSGLARHPLKKLDADPEALLLLLHRWREEAAKYGHAIARIAVAFEAGRDGFWLERWLRARDVEAFVIHSTSVAVPREHRRAKTDRLDTEHFKCAFLGSLRGGPNHCQMAEIPSLDEEDARRPNRERENLVSQQTSIVNRMKACLIRLGVRKRVLVGIVAADAFTLASAPHARTEFFSRRAVKPIGSAMKALVSCLYVTPAP